MLLNRFWAPRGKQYVLASGLKPHILRRRQRADGSGGNGNYTSKLAKRFSLLKPRRDAKAIPLPPFTDPLSSFIYAPSKLLAGSNQQARRRALSGITHDNPDLWRSLERSYLADRIWPDFG